MKTNNLQCPFCGSKNPHQYVKVPEMMNGTREEFDYAECASCKSLFICRMPEDLMRFYGGDYYSFNSQIRPPVKIKWLWNLMNKLRRIRSGCVLGKKSLMGRVMCHLKGEPEFAKWITECGIDESCRILDIGCGDGRLLMDLETAGFRNLTGIDPFLEADRCEGAVRLHKCGVNDLEGEYDLIMMHHSLEHIADPASALQGVRRLMAKDGQAMIRVPVAQSFAHKKYGVFWVEWDAPRHLSIPSEEGMRILIKQTGLNLKKVVYDSDAFQFIGSELYRRGFPLLATDHHIHFTKKELREFAIQSEVLNENKTGGRAVFYLSV